MFQTTQGLVRGASNLFVANMYSMVAFKIHVFDASLFEETPNKSIIRFGNHFYHGCPRGYTKVCNHPQPPTSIRNHTQASTTNHNHLQLPTTTNNYPQPPTTTHNHPKITQKSQNLSQTVMLLHLDVNTETDVDFDSDMRQCIYIHVCVCMYILHKLFYLLFSG